MAETFKKSVPVFVDKITKLSMEDVYLPKRRDKFIQEEIRTKASIAKREGFPEYNKKYFNSAIKKRRRELAEVANPLGARTDRMTKAEGGTTEDQMNALAISAAPARVEEQETHTMPDGTEMPGATHE